VSDWLAELDGQPALALAETASAAALLDPGLLRALRLRLHPELDAGAEADVVLSEAVRSVGPRFIVFEPEALEVLRERLRKRLRHDPDVMTDIRWVMARRHPQPPPTVAMQETVILHWLEGKPVDAVAIQQLFGSVVKALKDGERQGFARWAVGMLASLPQEVRRSEAASTARVAASLQTGVPGPAPISGDALRWVIGETVSDVALGVRLAGDVLEVTGEARTGRAFHVIEVPATEPRYLEVIQGDERKLVAVEAGAFQRVDVKPGSVTLRDGRGRGWKLTRHRNKRPGGSVPS